MAEEDVSSEMSRLASFVRWPNNSAVRPISLMLAGFHMTGPQEVTCFRCNLKVSSWNEGEDVWEKHCQLSPSCEFIVSRNGNTPKPTTLLDVDPVDAGIPDLQETQIRPLDDNT